MPYLIAVSLLWAFSFGLIKGRLAGLDSAFISAVRLGLALLVFLPFLRFRGLTSRLTTSLVALGAVQFGLMYLAYNESFRHLQAHEVALLTLTTPVFVTLIADALDRTLRVRALAAALLAVLGTGVVVFQGQDLRPTLLGLALVQLSNLAFAAGQVGYKRLRARQPDLRDRDIFGLLYAGGFALALAACFARGDISVELTGSHLLVLLYLGVLASGVGFFLWNLGATQVGTGALAVMNNAKIPLAVACSLLFFGEYADPSRLAISLVLLSTAVWFAEKR
ncbi:EamA-like transporter family protein [Lacunisphaera limnophila]|uniref:EamA-like transporter family protein n=1 Tax=Lacunisphaera limnophila TaxID=1838286 RepID=A0A1D8AY87_9BACT|nr:EamA family transporter [Lacunisphaera limnophila]AOS45862.1 EamA-like transporter family protein [Lacunisphaera limnophila]